MNYWIFIVKNQTWDGNIHTGEEIFHQRMKDQFWGIGEKTPNRMNLNEDDRIVYYIAVPKKTFSGTAELASSSFKLNESQKKKYAHGIEFYVSDYGVLLKEINTWPTQKVVTDELVSRLKFIENKEFWGGYFQGGIRQIPEDDYRTIVGERPLVEKIAAEKDIESPEEFALESHLEEFIYENWSKIKWGTRLELYRTDEQDGRQFPAGPWSIDFLAVDKTTNDLVVIELKRGKTSDATVGQLLRYISWVKENIADSSRNVGGIIIAKKVDDALKYAVKDLGYINIRTYEVDFKLHALG
ncbi:endonuclease NucS domain-containing protein [Chloroflexota bacterium]